VDPVGFRFGIRVVPTRHTIILPTTRPIRTPPTTTRIITMAAMPGAHTTADPTLVEMAVVLTGAEGTTDRGQQTEPSNDPPLLPPVELRGRISTRFGLCSSVKVHRRRRHQVSRNDMNAIQKGDQVWIVRAHALQKPLSSLGRQS